ncbi:MAG: hypothetical protein DRQ89_12330 [Epsilonproteobacteria bacterium]|nr:MAG: hypothetical protein DRQ89_12330 [Campylobacterota bacterium]
MDDNERAVLEIESEKGERAKAAWDTFIEPFFVAKTEQLFGTFIALPTTKPEDLMLVKMQANALESLKDELQGHINTGKLASKAIKDEDDANRE